MKRDREASGNVSYPYVEKSTSSGRIDLNDLLERAHTEKKRDSRTNLLILSGVVGISFIVVLILSF